MNHQTINCIKKIGWAEIEISNESLKYLNDLIFYSDSLSQNIKDSSTNLDSFQNLVQVSTIRSILRYSNQSKIFVKSLAEDLVNHYPTIKDFYITPPYIIYHQPNELVAEEGYHRDTLKHCGKLYTCWTPINNYKMGYPALTLINKSHKLSIKIIYKILSKIKFSKYINRIFQFLLIKPNNLNVKKNFTYFWDSDLLHKGNQNKTNKSHVALVVRISEKPLYYEPTAKILAIIKSHNLMTYEKKISYNELIAKLFEICEVAKNNTEIIKYSCNLRDTNDQNFLKHLSFSLSIISQKLCNNFSSNLDLISFLLAKENLVSLERFLMKFKGQDISREIIKKFFIDKELSYQEALVINNFNSQNLDDVQNLKKTSWI
jgi:hypothetical protein